MADRPAQREAPVLEVEVTPEMIEAGANVLYSAAEGDPFTEVVQEVYRAMAKYAPRPSRCAGSTS